MVAFFNDLLGIYVTMQVNGMNQSLDPLTAKAWLDAKVDSVLFRIDEYFDNRKR